MKALGGGNLAADYREALDYVFSRSFVDSVMLGMSSRSEVNDLLDYLEGELGEKEFFGGEHGFGFLDIALVPFSTWFESFDKFWGVGVAEVAPKLAAWAARCMERESVSKNVFSPEKVSDFIGEMRKDLGIE
jgi:glutathione S-transferase